MVQISVIESVCLRLCLTALLFPSRLGRFCSPSPADPSLRRFPRVRRVPTFRPIRKHLLPRTSLLPDRFRQFWPSGAPKGRMRLPVLGDMCLYHYLYFSSCQHGELSRISYCDKANSLGLAERQVHTILKCQPQLTRTETVFLSAAPAQSSHTTISQTPLLHCVNGLHHLLQAVIALHIRTISSNIAPWQLYHLRKLARQSAAVLPRSTTEITCHTAKL